MTSLVRTILALTLALAALGCEAPEDVPEVAPEAPLATASSGLSLTFNGARIAMSGFPAASFANGVPAGFDAWLAQISAEYYTHAAITLDPTGWTGFTKVEDLRAPLQRAMTAARARGIKLLPMITIGSASSGWWSTLTDPAVQMNRISLPGGGLIASPTYAPDPNGMDAQFARLVQVIRDAGNLPDGGYDGVDAVVLSYDEFGDPYPIDRRYHVLVPGGAPAGLPGSHRASQLDRDFVLAQTSGSNADKLAALVNTSIHRRMKKVQEILGSSTKVLVYGDEWDPESTGGYKYHSFLSPTEWVHLSPSLRRLVGLTESQKTAFRSGVIFVPWQYTWGSGGDRDSTTAVDLEPRYNAFAALEAFEKAGFKFIYTAAFDSDTRVACEARIAMWSYLYAARCFPRSSVGYLAAQWRYEPNPPGLACPDQAPLPDPLDIRHELYVANASTTARSVDDHWTAPLSSSSAPWRTTWGNPATTSADTLALSFDDVVRRAPLAQGYALRFRATFNGGDMAIYPDFGIPGFTGNYPAIRRVGGTLTLGGLAYGRDRSFGTAGAFTGQQVSADVADVALFVKASARAVAMRVQMNGSVYRTGFIPYANLDPGLLQLVGGNNSGSATSKTTLSPIVGCAGMEDAWVDEMYRNQ